MVKRSENGYESITVFETRIKIDRIRREVLISYLILLWER